MSDSAHSLSRSKRASPVRPVYIIAHRANSPAEVKACLALGVNALEVDVNVRASNPTALCVAHGPMIGTGPANDNASSLPEFLSELCQLAKGTRLALVYFDCKPPVARQRLGPEMLDAIRTGLAPLNGSDCALRFVLSVPTREYGPLLTGIHPLVGAHGLLMIDQEWQPRNVAAFFARHSIQRYGTGNGSSVANALLSSIWPPLPRSVRDACTLRGTASGPAFVSTFTVNGEAAMRRYLHMGVDGIMSDRVPPLYSPGAGLSRLVSLVEHEGDALGVRLATRSDAAFDASAPQARQAPASDRHSSNGRDSSLQNRSSREV